MIADFIFKAYPRQWHHYVSAAAWLCKKTIHVHMIMLMSIITWLSFMAICLHDQGHVSRSLAGMSRWWIYQLLLHSCLVCSWWWGLVASCGNIPPFKRQGQACQSTLTLLEGYQAWIWRTVIPFTFVTNYYTNSSKKTSLSIIARIDFLVSYMLYPELNWKRSKTNFNFSVMVWET